MRRLPLPLLMFGLLAGCAGNVADYVGSRPDIIRPQLARFGLDETQAQCIAQKLADSLTPLQLRRLTRYAGVVREGFYDPARLEIRDLIHVASSMSDPQIRLELTRAAETCNVGTEPPAPEQPPVVTFAPPPPRPAAWLNLGAAPTGQSIAVDASTLEQDGGMRKAWFRLTNPNEPAPTGVSYLLRIDCTARTLEALAHRRQDSAGAVADFHEYARDEEGPLPIEGGTVMEIAFLALCT